jgi:hypothetical protein
MRIEFSFTCPNRCIIGFAFLVGVALPVFILPFASIKTACLALDSLHEYSNIAPIQNLTADVVLDKKSCNRSPIPIIQPERWSASSVEAARYLGES